MTQAPAVSSCEKKIQAFIFKTTIHGHLPIETDEPILGAKNNLANPIYCQLVAIHYIPSFFFWTIELSCWGITDYFMLVFSYTEVSINGDTPKMMVYFMENPIEKDDWRNHHTIFGPGSCTKKTPRRVSPLAPHRPPPRAAESAWRTSETSRRTGRWQQLA